MRKKDERLALSDAATPLFTLLRAERAKLAKEQAVPAYVIFHDTTLAAIAAARPQTLAELEKIPGMGKSKMDRYGAIVLATVRGA
jgi:ATP-dependent DNA helicase RecQ